MYHQIKNKFTNDLVYFRFFSPQNRKKIWYTKTTESVGFEYGDAEDWIPLKKTWEQIYNDQRRKD